MRLFLAIPIPEKIKLKLEKQIADIKKDYPQFNWVSNENFHITVHFFGERNDVEKIITKIKNLLWNQSTFYLYSFELDVFVNHKLITYLNFRRQKEIEDLAYLIKSNFEINYHPQKFVPHLTLARGPRSSKQQYFALQRKLKKTKIDISFPVEKLILFESILTGKKPFYKEIASFSFLK
ncbi:MAG: RNA 2',3'-cyclic phosphodiesterase [Microgenomates group bacterium]